MVYGEFSKKELKDSIVVLKQCDLGVSFPELKESANKVADFLETVLNNMSASGEDISMLMNRKDCIGSILWAEEDVLFALTDEGYEASEENLNEVISQLSIEDLGDCEHGWEVIADAISKASDSLKKKDAAEN